MAWDVLSRSIDERINQIALDPATATTPTLVVEGSTDVEFLTHVAKFDPLFENAYELVVAGSKREYKDRLIQGGIPFRHCALLDADHDVQLGTLFAQPHIVYTDYYSIENYLVTDSVIRATLARMTTVAEAKRLGSPGVFNSLRVSTSGLACICYLRVSNNWIDLPMGDSVSIWDYADFNTLQPDFTRTKGHLGNYISGVLKQKVDAKKLDTLMAGAKAAVDSLTVEEYLKLVPGKHLLDVLYRYLVVNQSGLTMDKKSYRRFFRDLCCFLDSSPAALGLLALLARQLFPPPPAVQTTATGT